MLPQQADTEHIQVVAGAVVGGDEHDEGEVDAVSDEVVVPQDADEHRQQTEDPVAHLVQHVAIPATTFATMSLTSLNLNSTLLR